MTELLSQKKLDLIAGNVAILPTYIEKLVKKRPDQYEIKKEEWSIKCNQIKNILDQKSYFLFIGKFSSGKSSFVNALIGNDILPTNSKPTTAVVTEVVFKEEGLTNGEVIWKDGSKDTKSKSEILEIIQGKTRIDIGAVHHVCLSININEKEFEFSRDAFRSFVDRVILVDCPGFDSPYRFSEEILYEYVEKASFTYYFLPAIGFGDNNEIKRLRNIRKRTATLIPLISKADLIEDEDKKNEIIDNFSRALADAFPNKEPIFVSTFKFKEFKAKCLELEEKINLNTISDEEQQQLNDLEIQAGIYSVSNEMSSDAQQNALNQKKIDSVKFEFDEIVNQLLVAVRNEENYWNKELTKINFNLNSKEYTDLVSSNRIIKEWITEESKEVSKNLKNNIVIEVTNHVNRTSGRPNPDTIKTIFKDCFSTEIEKRRDVWAKKFKEYFKAVCHNFDKDPEFKIPDFGFGLPGKHVWEGIVDGLSKAGGDVIFMALTGGTLIGSQALIASITLVGSVLAPIAVIGGIALLGVAGFKGYNPIVDGIKHRKELRDAQISRKVDELLSKHTNFEAVISKLLNEYRENVYKQAVAERETDKTMKLQNYEDCQDLRETLETLQTNLNGKI